MKKQLVTTPSDYMTTQIYNRTGNIGAELFFVGKTALSANKKWVPEDRNPKNHCKCR